MTVWVLNLFTVRGSGDDWDSQYDAMSDGWLLFLLNLKLHLEHFRGQTATALLPTAM